MLRGDFYEVEYNVLFRLAWNYLRRRRVEVLGVVLLQLLATLAALELPTLNARIIDEGVAVADTAAIWRLGMLMVILTFAQGVATAIAVYVGSRVAMGLGAWLRERIFTHVQRFSTQDAHHFGAASLITRSTNDVQQIQTVVMMAFAIMVQAPIMGIGALILAYRQDTYLSSLLWVMVPVLSIVVGIMMKLLAPQFALQQVRLDAMNMVLREELTGQRVIRAFVRQDYMGRRYAEANEALRRVALTIGGLFALMFPLLMLIVSATNVAVVWYGGHSVDAGTSNIGSLFAFISYIGMLFGSVMMSAMMLMMYPRAEIAATRVREVVDTSSSVKEAEEPTTIDGGAVFSLADVSLQYPGAEQPVLKNITVAFPAGSTTGIIGATGSGKTTLVNLLPRLMDPTQGAVVINATHDIRDVALSDVRRRVAMVPQKAYLFSGTIASTVSGKDSPTAEERERVVWALKGACAMEFVSRLDEGIDSEVHAGGKNFSGGQRQRLTIARALYRDADLYIFDDSSSALDHVTDAALRENLHTYTGKGAVILVAQRVATVKECDSILVLDAGQIIGQGTHAELLATCPTYREIVESQATREEER